MQHDISYQSTGLCALGLSIALGAFQIFESDFSPSDKSARQNRVFMIRESPFA